MQREKLSALMDGEMFDNELLVSLAKDRTLQQSWQSYHLIRDVLRGDSSDVIHIDIASRVAAALEKEPVRLIPSGILEAQPHPGDSNQSNSEFNKRAVNETVRLPLSQRVRPWIGQLMQVGVAASVSLFVIVGVQYYKQPAATEQGFESPAFNTIPIMGQASPVSLGVPAQSLSISNGQQQQVQEQRKRINAMLQDYELQRRLHSDLLELEQLTPQHMVEQVTGSHALGIQQ
ncbi:anti-sigma-E factor RseA [Serratia microhaemolytica]|uniref:anti-sigma-E factor RseA n=1 Tax=Serratia microhaemolytica TaxID=2675110 RepID=UPI000FDD568A|nr:anti-sigma-E factor RseA [Serratia microhaemolytica]